MRDYTVDFFERSRHLADLGFQPHDQPSAEEIKKRWKELCMKHHPDKGGNVEDFQRITHAYQMLTDPEYEYKNRGLDKSNLDLRIQFGVKLEEALFGKTFVFSYNVLEFNDSWDPITKELLEADTITVEIQKGDLAPQERVFTGKGHRHKNRRGNAIICPGLIQDKRFGLCREVTFGKDAFHITSQKSVPLATLLKGGIIHVATAYGMRKVRVPPATVPGTQLRVPGCGARGGDHIVTVSAAFPKEAELRGNDWKGFEIKWDDEYVAEEDDKEAEELLAQARLYAESVQNNIRG